MKDFVFIPINEKPDAETQKLIDEGKLIKSMATTGGINPSAKGLRAGVFYKRVQNSPPHP